MFSYLWPVFFFITGFAAALVAIGLIGLARPVGLTKSSPLESQP